MYDKGCWDEGILGYEPVVLNCLFPFLFFFCAKFPGFVGSCPVNFLAIGP